MNKFKQIFIGLLILISVSFIYVYPGMGIFDIFHSLVFKQLPMFNLYNYYINSLRFPIGTQALFVVILNISPLDYLKPLFTLQNAWLSHKFVIWTFYILTWISILFFTKFTKIKSLKLSLINTSLYYFLSFSLLLISIALSNPEILAAPFFVFSIIFLFKKKFKLTFIFIILSILFSWTTLIFLPMYSWYILTETKGKSFVAKFIHSILIVIFLSFFTIYFWGLIKFGTSIVISDLLSNALSFGLIKFIILFSESNLTILGLNLIFIFSYIFSLNKIIKLNLEKNLKFLIGLLCLLFIFVVLFPIATDGSLIWLTILSLLIWIRSPSKFTKTNLLLINILVFVNIYLFFGPSGTVPIRGKFIEVMKYSISLMSIIFACWYLKLKLFSKLNINPLLWMQKYLILFIFLTFFAHFPAEGCPEATDYVSYIKGAFKYGNPLVAQAQSGILNYHPPLNILILSFFALIWNKISNTSNGFYEGLKLAISFFYLLTVACYVKFGKSMNRNKILNNTEKLLAILTSFALIVGSLNQSDINIFLFPFIIISIYTLFRNKYFWSGLFIGIAFSIKWQAVLLLPLFAVSIIDFRKNIQTILKNTFYFLWGFVPIVMLFWILLLIQPGGVETIKTIINGFIRVRGNYLSGNSLNLGWIVGYFALPKYLELGKSLASAGIYNFPSGANTVPYIFRGVLFSMATLTIIGRYWIFQKKNIVNFLSTATMLYFSHQMLGRGAQELHFIYVVAFMLFLYLVNPTTNNKLLLILFNVMAIINLTFFYCLTGYPCLTKNFIGGFDITVILAAYYTVMFFWLLWRYLKDLPPFEKDRDIISYS